MARGFCLSDLSEADVLSRIFEDGKDRGTSQSCVQRNNDERNGKIDTVNGAIEYMNKLTGP